ncbi:BTB/POZ domain-containing protein 3-like [Paramacrobiotus metropolitanus]|uniref:BTB/POZ domain-containing protein 3-like n=1 Tax=Paramacrobiotus metropolitanus TaxID=2943436 RepID=UPI002445FA09|nr:BTB/POZ domain-containing protein 3-like [Paramacrobiotus metropolitanus]
MSQNLTQSSGGENHPVVAKIGDCVKHLLDSGDMSDVQFAVGRDQGIVKIFSAHRIILGARSAVFHNMFYGSLPENCTNPINIPDVHPDAFANILSYIYTDAVKSLNLDNLFGTLGCADKYDLPLLVVMCTDFILAELSIDNCLDVLDSAVHCAVAAPSILEKCLCLIDESAEAIWVSEKFCAIGQEALCAILQRDTLTANEDIICLAVNEWAVNMCARRDIDATSANRREVLGRALFLIRFPLLTDAQLLDGPADSGLLLQSEGWDIYRYKHATTKPRLSFCTEPRQNVRAEGVINYTIPDIRELRKAALYSDPVNVRKLLWNIAVNKNIDREVPALGFYLQCDGYAGSDSWACQVAAELCLLPWKPETPPVKKQVSKLFNKNAHSKGSSKYISMEELLDPAKGYINPTDFSLRLQIQMIADLPTGFK